MNDGFDDFAGTISNFDGNNIANASVAPTIPAASIDAEKQKRDDHLRSADILAVDSFPVISFKSTKVMSIDRNRFQIVGNLTIHGITEPVTFDAELNGILEALGSQRATSNGVRLLITAVW